MNRVVRIALPAVLVAGMSCSSSTPTPAPTPAPGPTVAQAGGGQAQAAGGQRAGGGAAAGGAQAGRGAPGGGRGPQMTPEQRAAQRAALDTARGAAVADLMKQIAGHEKDPAGQVFKNVVLLKDMPADQFLTTMDRGYGYALGRGCTFCHEGGGDYAADTKQEKKTARTMIEIVASINKDLMPKMPNARPPQIQCVTCHRGNSSPGRALTP